MTPLNAFKNKNLPEQLADHVVEMIASGALKPGQRVFEKDISDLLGVSRIPVREAMRLLQASGVVHSEPNRGSFVSELSLLEAEETLDVRLKIESLALTRLVKDAQARERAVNSLHQSLEGLRTAAKVGNALSYCKADLAFHHNLVEQSHSMTLQTLWESLSRNVLIFLVQERMVGFDYDRSIKDHERLISLISKGDQDALSAEIEQHIKGSFSGLITQRTNHENQNSD